MEFKTYDYLIKLLTLGDSGVGKSSLLIRFVDNKFSSSFMSTIGIDFKIKTIDIKDKKIKLQIWDTAGQERYNTITRSYYRDAMGILLVYDITSISSFRNINKWLNQLDLHATDNVEKILVGNKIDLAERRAVHFDLGQKLAEEKSILFAEVSAMTGEGVDDLYVNLTCQILKRRNLFESNTKAPTLRVAVHQKFKLKPNKKRVKCCKK